jgi:hypothetical protein
MNKRIRALMDQAVSFRLDPDSNAYEALVSPEDLTVFAELIVQECCNRLSKETIRHDGYGYNQHELYRRLREHFGVES